MGLKQVAERQHAATASIRPVPRLTTYQGGRASQGSSGRRQRWATAVPYVESLLCLIAVAGLTLSLLGDFQSVRTTDYVATDYKTLYASAALFRHGGNPYSMAGIVEIYRESGVVLPRSMFGHAPVYPPVTLLLLWPLTYLSMGQSAMAWLVTSAAASAVALAMVLREARRQGLHWSLRLGIAAFTAGAPVLGYALDIGNVSPAVGALAAISLLMALRESHRSRARLTWGLVAGGISLGLALCVKPHSAIWVFAGILLVCGSAGKLVAGISGGVFLLGNLTSLVILYMRGAAQSVVGSLVAMLVAESRSGSMSPASREALPAMAQLTGVNSLFGLWIGQPVRGALVAMVVLALLGSLLRVAWRTRWRGRDGSWQVLIVAALFAVGMLASYHRAHDAVMLPALLGLWLAHAIRRSVASRVSRAKRWVYGAGSASVLLLLAAGWIDLPVRAGDRIAIWWGVPALRDLVGLRQGAVVTAALALALVILSCLTRPTDKKTARIF